MNQAPQPRLPNDGPWWSEARRILGGAVTCAVLGLLAQFAIGRGVLKSQNLQTISIADAGTAGLVIVAIFAWMFPILMMSTTRYEMAIAPGRTVPVLVLGTFAHALVLAASTLAWPLVVDFSQTDRLIDAWGSGGAFACALVIAWTLSAIGAGAVQLLEARPWGGWGVLPALVWWIGVAGLYVVLTVSGPMQADPAHAPQVALAMLPALLLALVALVAAGVAHRRAEQDQASRRPPYVAGPA